MDEDDEEDAEMAYEDEEDEDEADVPSAEHMSVGSTEVHDMLLGSEASPARSTPAAEPSRRCVPGLTESAGDASALAAHSPGGIRA